MVPAERLSMRKIKEVLRLKFQLGFGNRQIARSCSMNHGTGQGGRTGRMTVTGWAGRSGIGKAVVSRHTGASRAAEGGTELACDP